MYCRQYRIMRPEDALYGTGIAVVFAPWRKIWGGSFTPAVMDECWYALRFISLRKFSKELLCEHFRMRRTDPLTLAAQAGSYGESSQPPNRFLGTSCRQSRR